MDELQQLKDKIAEYERRMGIGQYDPAKEGYLVLVGILNQQNIYLKNFVLSSKIASDDKADIQAYKNSKDLWENLPFLIEKVTNLKIALKMEGEEKKTVEKPLSASDIANGKF